MSEKQTMPLTLLPSGVPGLDEVLGGGLPEYSFNLVAGPPGSGKTTLIHQLLFANATVERPAIYFTVLGEPSIKMLRYQQQMTFFDPEKVGAAIRFIDVSQEVLTGDLGRVLKKMVQQVKEVAPALLVVDSFRTMMRAKAHTASGESELLGFLQRLALHLASWQVTSFLLGEYSDRDINENPVATIADSILWLTQSRERNAIVRKLQVMKMRGVASLPGVHTFRISSDGIQVFPRTSWRRAATYRAIPRTRISTGVAGLDSMLGGGLLRGDATLVAGPSGTGKTVLSTHFIAEGVRQGETGVLAIFEEHVDDYVARAADMGFDLRGMMDAGKIAVLSLRPLDLSSDEILHQIQAAVLALGAQRLVIDSLNGLELALAPNFREDFRDALYRMLGSLTGGGVSVVLTVEVEESFAQIMFSPHAVSFLAQNIVYLRYVEIEARLQKVLTVVKMRRSEHSSELHAFEITPRGMHILQRLSGYQGILTGVPTPSVRSLRSATPGLTDVETAVLDTLMARREASQEVLATLHGPHDSLVRALVRLVDLNYVIKVVENDQTVYRPAMRPLGG